MTTDALERLDALVASAPADAAEGLALFDALPALEVDELIGSWDGGLLRTGHPGEAAIDALGWAGKDMRSAEDVDPIMVHTEGGGREASDVMGAARLRTVSYRGVATATMVYDRHPILDHFRRLGPDHVLGAMDRKGEDGPLLFFLRRRR